MTNKNQLSMIILKKWTPVVMALLLALIVGCDSGGSSDSSKVMGGMAEPVIAHEAQKQSENAPVPQRKVIKEGELHFTSADLVATRQAIHSAVDDLDGYLAGDELRDRSDRQEHRLVIRVPADRFDELLERISATASKIDRKNINARDVTEEYIDVEARINTKAELEDRYKSLLNRAETVEEILKIEREIGALRSEIESLQGRLNYLRNQVELSTLTVVYYQHKTTAFGFWGKISNAVHSGWNGLLWVLVGIASIWPFLVIGLLSYFVAIRLNKRAK